MFRISHFCKSLLMLVIIGITVSTCNDDLSPLSGIEERSINDLSVDATVAVSQENPGGATANEGSLKLTDGDKNSKFLIFGYTSDFWMEQSFDEGVTVNAYTLTSGNDAPPRDPQSWTFEGSDNGEDWEVIEEISDATFSLRNKTAIYELDSEVTYQQYRLSITANAGSSLLQISEWRLLNIEG
ncbi:discoidin domain-containing protein [Fodinibius salsisoli]|uniref:Discoidin domain-containing protein n=1 Tax=Fodinibius salsisoli TaxID=2820877 RepID=A0ABT3PKV0_9BACT|nr:discoidin domain-containing protein [Fodinibius salsisoli]MCW9706480.1 discoidin domain-containing protein [Fodinibius salsisoli]